MPHFDNATLEVVVYCTAAVLILFVGYRLGRFFGALRAARQIARKEEELFTAQRGFKNL